MLIMRSTGDVWSLPSHMTAMVGNCDAQDPFSRPLQELGIVPDKVIFLMADNEVLLDRTRHRKMDYETMKVSSWDS